MTRQMQGMILNRPDFFIKRGRSLEKGIKLKKETLFNQHLLF